MHRWREYLDADVDVFCYAGDPPCNRFVIGETVLIVDREPDVCAFIESENETVRAWGLEVIGTYRTDADRLQPDAFGEVSSLESGRT